MDKYDFGAGLLGGLERGLGAYWQTTERNKERELQAQKYADLQKQQDLSNQIALMNAGLIQTDEGLIRDPEWLKMKKELALAGRPTYGLPVLTEGQKAADVAAGKEYQEYVSGGKQEVEQNLGLLKGAAEQLRKDPGLSGGWTTKVPLLSSDVAQKVINPEGIATRDRVRSAIQSSIKQLYPGAVSDSEAKRVFELAYDPQLSGEENYKRIMRQVEGLKNKATAKESAMSHFGTRGTLQGFQGGLMPNKANAQKVLTPEDQKALDWAKKNPEDPRAAAILERLGM